VVASCRTKNLRDGLQFVREGDIVYQAGEVIASGIVRKAADGQALKSGLESIVYMANRNVAEKIYERHQFFTEQFIAAGVDPEIAERDACRIEHAISQDTFEKIRDAHKQEK